MKHAFSLIFLTLTAFTHTSGICANSGRTSSGAQASLYRKGDAFELIASSDIQLEMPVPAGKPPVVSAADNPDRRVRGAMRKGNVYVVSLAAGHYIIK